MPAYVRFIQNGAPVRGSVATGVHAGWTHVHSLQIPMQAGEATPRLAILTSANDSSLLALNAGATANRLPHAGGMIVGMGDGSVRSARHFRGFVSRFSAGARGFSPLSAEVDFTDVKGGDIPVLRALLRGLRLLGRERISHGGTDVALETVVIEYEGMTRAGASSFQDITQEVRTLLHIYDFPGEYAQRFDGVDQGGANARVQQWQHSYEFRTGKWA